MDRPLTPPASTLVPLDITDLSSEGWGEALWRRTQPPASLQEIPVTIPFAIDGENVVACVDKRKVKGRARYLGTIHDIVTPSVDRVAPRCRHFGSCGGCQWQHMAYEKQLAIKQGLIGRLFSPLMQGSDSSCLRPIIGSTSPWGYRNKMEFSFSQDKHGTRFLGLMLMGSKGKVFELQECHLADSWFAECVRAVRTWWQESALTAYWPSKNQGHLRSLTLRHGRGSGDRMVILTVSGNPDYAVKRRDLDRFVSMVREAVTPEEEAALSIILRVQQLITGQPTQVYEMVLFGPDFVREQLHLVDASGATHAYEFHISPQAFFQPNAQTVNELYSQALALCRLSDDMVVYDLYAGIGIFGMLAARHVRKIYAIELSKDAAYDAKTNAQRLGIGNFHILQGDVGRVLAEEVVEAPDLIFVDPPRVGLSNEAITHIVRLAPRVLVYMSCNPHTQVRDVAHLVGAGFSLSLIQPIDQFPQTPHVENIVSLVRGS